MSAGLRVLQIIYSFDIEGRGGGVERFGLALSQALRALGVEVHLCGLWQFGSATEQRRLAELHAAGLPAVCAAPWDAASPYNSFRRSLSGLQAYARRYPPQIVHSHSEFGDLAALALKFGAGRPAALRSVHYGYRQEWRKRPLRRLFLTNLLYPLLFNAEIGISPAIAQGLDERPLARLLGKRAKLLINAIDLTRFANPAAPQHSLRRELQLPDETFIIGSVGRLSEQKGYTYLIQAAAQVVQALPGAHFVLTGEGELRQELETQANTLGLSDRIHFLGARRDLEQLLPQFDLFASASLWEGLPTVIMESMAAGVPLVATDIPGTRDLIRPGENGWLAPPADPAGLAQALITAAQDANRRAQYARQGKLDVQQVSIAPVAAQHLELYRKLLKR